MPARRPVPTLAGVIIKRAVNKITEVTELGALTLYSSITFDERSSSQSLNETKQELNQLKENINFWPSSSLKVITPVATEEVDKILLRYKLLMHADPEAYTEFCRIVMQALLFTCIEELDVRFLVSGYIRDAIIDNLHCLTNLISLKLTMHVSVINKTLLPEKIPQLKRLEAFECGSNCDDVILEKLSQYCPNLKSVKVSLSKYVTEQSVEHLLKLKQLEYLDITSTNISREGYRRILLGLYHLTNVACDEEIENVIRNTETRFRRINHFYGLVKRAAILPNEFPNIKYLILGESCVWDIRPLTDLPQLEYLRLIKFNYVFSQIGKAISDLGQRLVELMLDFVVMLNVCDIINYCTALKSLTINLCVFSEDKIQTISPNMTHFQSLTTLRLQYNKADRWYNSVIPNYLNLEILDARNVADFNDEYFSEAVSEGWLINLKQFLIEWCPVTRDTVYLILENCPNLTDFGVLKAWPLMERMEEMEIRYAVEANNLNVKLLQDYEVRRERHLAMKHFF